MIYFFVAIVVIGIGFNDVYKKCEIKVSLKRYCDSGTEVVRKHTII